VTITMATVSWVEYFYAVRRKNSIRRSGKIRLRDARSDSADDDGLPAVIDAGRRVAGTAACRPASTAAGLVTLLGGGAPKPTSLPSATPTSTRSGAQAAMLYSWCSPPRSGRLRTASAGTARTGGSQRPPTGACIRSLRCGRPW
jgi:hypothetical protein